MSRPPSPGNPLPPPQVGSDASVAARVAGDQQATFYGNQAGGSLTDGTVTLSVDLVCDNQVRGPIRCAGQSGARAN